MSSAQQPLNGETRSPGPTVPSPGATTATGTELPGTLHTLGLREKFAKVHAENLFGGDVSTSGEGSGLVQTRVIRREIPLLLQKLAVRTFLDAPCGDCFWMKEVDLPVESYIGIDIVRDLVERNQKRFGSARVSFQCLDLVVAGLPRADLIFSRDCLVHLSLSDSQKILANFKRSGARYLLATTFVERTGNVELDCHFWRPLNMQLAPFHFPPPMELINEGCTEADHRFADKSLALWLLADIATPA